MLQVRSAPILGLGIVGWVSVAVFASALCALLWRRRLGPADQVTLARAILVGCVTALVVNGLVTPVPVWPLVVVASVALVLDAVDGKVARRTGTASAFGARFDMEVDAYLILVLSVQVELSLGWWVLAIGLMRYAYATAAWVLPWLLRPVPPRYWRKVVAAVQGIVLTVAASGLLPRPAAVVAVAAALALLVESFGRDVIWQWRHRLAQAGVDVAGAAKRPEVVKQLHQTGRV